MDDDLVRRVDEAVERMNELDLGVTTSRSGWIVAAVEAQLDIEEQSSQHVPAVIQSASLQRRGSRVIIPAGRIMPQR
jgi:hypothetical protein